MPSDDYDARVMVAPYQLPTVREMLAMNRQLPEDLRGRAVHLSFAKPVPGRVTDHFQRIHLTNAMLNGGEAVFYRPEVTQPKRTGVQLCPTCRQPMRQISLTSYRCEFALCFQRDNTPSRMVTHVSGPHRGVIGVKYEFDAEYQGRKVNVSCVVGFETKTIGDKTIQVPMVNGCLLLLDRRYRDNVLAAIYRTAGNLCEYLREEGVCDIRLGD